MKHCPKYDSSFRKALAVASMTLGAVLFVGCQQQTKETAADNSNQSSANQPLAQQVVSPPPPLLPSPSVSATPSPSPSPSGTQTPKVKAEPERVALSTGPVATSVDAANKRGPVTIRLTNGTTIKADEVWETAEGIWYRRRGVVTLLKRDQVKALENPPPTPSPSSTASPVPSP